jgi:hypothetical protein
VAGSTPAVARHENQRYVQYTFRSTIGRLNGHHEPPGNGDISL